MLRIDETSKTLVAPQTAGFVTEEPLDRTELLTLVATGWDAFAGEIGQPHLRYLAAAPEPAVEMLAFDESDGRVAVVQVSGESSRDQLSRALSAAAEVAGWDAQDLEEVHESLKAAVPGDSPRVVLVASSYDAETLATIDWLVRRHGLEIVAWSIHMVRFGSERLMSVVRDYPVRNAKPVDPAAEAQKFLAQAAGLGIEATVKPAGDGSSPPPKP